MKRVDFLIDGFNLYHSLIAYHKDTGVKTKWLDINSLCSSYIHLFGKDAQLGSVFYFSAIPYYLSSQYPDKIVRHKNYIECLKSTGVIPELGRFKEKTVYCNKCKSYLLKHEEKETDVSIGVKLMEVFLRDLCDCAVIISGDTDIAPAAKRCVKLCPQKEVIFAFPYRRKNKELQGIAPKSFSIGGKQYIKHQFSNPVQLPDGHNISKPKSW